MTMIRKTSHSLAAVGALVAILGATTVMAEAAARRDAPLIAAVKAVDLDTVRSLVVDQGADVNQTAPDGATALHWAVHKNDAELVDLLLEAGADVSVANRYGVRPISLAAENGNAEILEALLDAGADPNAALPEGETVLMTAARTGNAASIRVLLVRGADPNLRDGFRGQTALMWAAGRNNIEVIHALAELGADVHARTESPPRPPSRRTFSDPPPTGFTALAFAARGGHIDAVRVLLEAGADVNATLSDGQSALVVAAANANWALMDYMLDRGADPNLAGAGWNALHQTVRTRRMNVGFGTPGPIPSGTVDSIDIIRKLIAHGVDIDARMTTNGMKDGQRNRLNRLGATAFFLASKVTDTDAMRVLREAGADPLMPTADGTTPLMVAAGLAIWNPGEDGGSLPGQENEVLEAVRLLVELGNDLNATNYRGETPLHGAAFRGANVVVEYLVEQGADINAPDFQGRTAFRMAEGSKQTFQFQTWPETAEFLRGLGADTSLGVPGNLQERQLERDARANADGDLP
jgi:ankyrin repeat protein